MMASSSRLRERRTFSRTLSSSGAGREMGAKAFQRFQDIKSELPAEMSAKRMDYDAQILFYKGDEAQTRKRLAGMPKKDKPGKGKGNGKGDNTNTKSNGGDTTESSNVQHTNQEQPLGAEGQHLM